MRGQLCSEHTYQPVELVWDPDCFRPLLPKFIFYRTQVSVFHSLKLKLVKPGAVLSPSPHSLLLSWSVSGSIKPKGVSLPEERDSPS